MSASATGQGGGGGPREAGPPGDPSDAGCLSESQLSALLERSLSDEAHGVIEAHIDRCSTCRALVAELVRFRSGSDPGPDGDAGLDGSAMGRPGEAFLIADRYELLEPIGAGGMGIVYQATDLRLARKVAIKMLRFSGEVGASSQTRLLQEAQVLASLSHPSIVVVHDVGTFEDQVFMAMEYVGGTSLRAWIDRDRPPVPAILAVFVQMADALSVAHQAGLVHQDFKPDNVLVSPDGRARLSDFGLACPIATDAGGGPGKRRALAGTPAYIAPEVYRGGPSGPKSDQFAFCVSLYEAVYGEHPFGDLTRRTAEREILRGRVREAPPNSAVPPWLRAVVVQGLRQDPTQRMPSMAALSEALRSGALRGHDGRREGWPERAIRSVLQDLAERLRRYSQ